MLIGIYGDNAVDYAVTRMEALERANDVTELETWMQITARVRELSYSSIAHSNAH